MKSAAYFEGYLRYDATSEGASLGGLTAQDSPAAASKKKKVHDAKVKEALHAFKMGKLKMPNGKPVKDRKQAIAIALSMGAQATRKDAGTELSSLKRNSSGQVQYQGRWWTPNKPVASTAEGKKKMVLAVKDEAVKIVHFGAEGYGNNYSESARKSYMARSAGIKDGDGNATKDDKHSPNYWARKELWAGKGGAVTQPSESGSRKDKAADDPCWDGYEQRGTKLKGGKQVPNCTPMKKARKDEGDEPCGCTGCKAKKKTKSQCGCGGHDHADAAPKSQRQGDRVFVKNTRVKGGGFWRKVGKGLLIGAAGLVGLNVLGAGIGAAQYVHHSKKLEGQDDDDKLAYFVHHAYKSRDNEIQQLKDSPDDLHQHLHKMYNRGKEVHALVNQKKPRTDAAPPSQRQGDRVWVKDPKAKGGGFWRKLKKSGGLGAVIGAGLAAGAIAAAGVNTNTPPVNPPSKKEPEKRRNNTAAYVGMGVAGAAAVGLTAKALRDKAKAKAEAEQKKTPVAASEPDAETTEQRKARFKQEHDAFLERQAKRAAEQAKVKTPDEAKKVSDPAPDKKPEVEAKKPIADEPAKAKTAPSAENKAAMSEAEFQSKYKQYKKEHEDFKERVIKHKGTTAELMKMVAEHKAKSEASYQDLKKANQARNAAKVPRAGSSGATQTPPKATPSPEGRAQRQADQNKAQEAQKRASQKAKETNQKANAGQQQKPAASGDWHETLGVPKNADKATIKKAYLKLSRQHHPDYAPAGQKDKATAKMQSINAAYEAAKSRKDSMILLDLRRAYQEGMAYASSRMDINEIIPPAWNIILDVRPDANNAEIKAAFRSQKKSEKVRVDILDEALTEGLRTWAANKR